VWSVSNADGGAAVLLVNRASVKTNLTFTLEEVPGLVNTTAMETTAAASAASAGVKGGAGGAGGAACFKVRDLWAHADQGTLTAGQKFEATVQPMDCVMVRLTPC
jgi:hypothetical protein